MENNKALPRHIGYVVDGNRRWAKLNGVKEDVHRRGADVVMEVAKRTIAAGVPYATFYVFSTENWQRSDDEVNYIMKLFIDTFNAKMDELLTEDLKILFLGSRERLGAEVLAAMDETEAKTANAKRGTVCFCLNYGGRQEIADAAERVAKSGEEITVDGISANLYHPEIPDLDMMVRTGGELRLSNFMLWRVAYAELMFLDQLWPDLTVADVDKIIEEYGRRQRRFGK